MVLIWIFCMLSHNIISSPAPLLLLYPLMSCVFLKVSSLMRCFGSPDLEPLSPPVSGHLHISASNLSFNVFLSPSSFLTDWNRMCCWQLTQPPITVELNSVKVALSVTPCSSKCPKVKQKHHQLQNLYTQTNNKQLYLADISQRFREAAATHKLIFIITNLLNSSNTWLLFICLSFVVIPQRLSWSSTSICASAAYTTKDEA